MKNPKLQQAEEILASHISQAYDHKVEAYEFPTGEIKQVVSLIYEAALEDMPKFGYDLATKRFSYQKSRGRIGYGVTPAEALENAFALEED